MSVENDQDWKEHLRKIADNLKARNNTIEEINARNNTIKELPDEISAGNPLNAKNIPNDKEYGISAGHPLNAKNIPTDKQSKNERKDKFWEHYKRNDIAEENADPANKNREPNQAAVGAQKENYSPPRWFGGLLPNGGKNKTKRKLRKRKLTKRKLRKRKLTKRKLTKRKLTKRKLTKKR